MLREGLEELKDLGPRRAWFRLGWELKTRTGWASRTVRAPEPVPSPSLLRFPWAKRLPFADPVSVVQAVRDRIPAPRLSELKNEAKREAQGVITCFGRWQADYGNPPNFHLNPLTGASWNRWRYWSFALLDESSTGDVKIAWEPARFPHAFRMARAGSFFSEEARVFSQALRRQVKAFVEQNPFQRGIHWHSGQEMAFREMAWLFAVSVLWSHQETDGELDPMLQRQLLASAAHVEAIIDYARLAVYNNHLLSEALLLYFTGILFPEVKEAKRWRDQGRALLSEGAERQFGTDGSYIQNSHNYHRVALQDLLWAVRFSQVWGEKPPQIWMSALERSLDFLYAHQNPADGRLPNFGANDGALPAILTTCDFSDFRPLLQAVSVGLRGERLYPPGPWDEEAAWMWGPEKLDVPMRAKTTRTSVSIQPSGYHVLRSEREDSFAAFRCGSIRDRFAQIDMLHLDVFWRGQNVLVDGGSYHYNAAKKWHDHFHETGCHNTLMVNGADQMVHHRRFKNLYWTKAELRNFEQGATWVLAEGEHQGYERAPYRCLHRRAVLSAGPDLWIVIDSVWGQGERDLRLQWLGGPFPFAVSPESNGTSLTLNTPEGPFAIQVFSQEGDALPVEVVAGGENPPRGWLSRYYGEKVPAPSLSVERREQLPCTWLTVLGAGHPTASLRDGMWVVKGTNVQARFQIDEGSFQHLEVIAREDVR